MWRHRRVCNSRAQSYKSSKLLHHQATKEQGAEKVCDGTMSARTLERLRGNLLVTTQTVACNRLAHWFPRIDVGNPRVISNGGEVAEHCKQSFDLLIEGRSVGSPLGR
jgi:hypothetical protein